MKNVKFKRFMRVQTKNLSVASIRNQLKVWYNFKNNENMIEKEK